MYNRFKEIGCELRGEETPRQRANRLEKERITEIRKLWEQSDKQSIWERFRLSGLLISQTTFSGEPDETI